MYRLTYFFLKSAATADSFPEFPPYFVKKCYISLLSKEIMAN